MSLMNQKMTLCNSGDLPYLIQRRANSTPELLVSESPRLFWQNKTMKLLRIETIQTALLGRE